MGKNGSQKKVVFVQEPTGASIGGLAFHCLYLNVSIFDVSLGIPLSLP
jgi:hypothetical protein